MESDDTQSDPDSASFKMRHLLVLLYPAKPPSLHKESRRIIKARRVSGSCEIMCTENRAQCLVLRSTPFILTVHSIIHSFNIYLARKQVIMKRWATNLALNKPRIYSPHQNLIQELIFIFFYLSALISTLVLS